MRGTELLGAVKAIQGKIYADSIRQNSLTRKQENQMVDQKRLSEILGSEIVGEVQVGHGQIEANKTLHSVRELNSTNDEPKRTAPKGYRLATEDDIGYDALFTDDDKLPPEKWSMGLLQAIEGEFFLEADELQFYSYAFVEEDKE